MQQNYFESSLGQTGIKVQRLGLSGTYRPGVATIHKAFDEGLNYFFCYGIDTQMIKVLRDISKSKRENLIIATGAYNLLVGHPNLRRTLEKRLRQLGTDYIDVFLFLGVMKQKHFGKRELEEMIRFREEGKVRSIGISCHNRKFAGELAASGVLDVVMIRYNAAHRGAELDIFPYLKNHNTGVVGYTATRWKYLMRRPKAWSKDKPLPTAGMCYRFVLSNPNIHVCMTAPSNLKQLEENLAAFRKGSLPEDEMQLMQEFGDVVYNEKRWFM